MFSLNWFLGLLPTWVPWAIVVTGILLFIIVQALSFLIPITYRAIIVITVELLGVALFGFGFYIDGRQDVIINEESKIKQVVEEQQEITNKVVEDFQSKTSEVKVRNETIIKYITKKDDHFCRIPKSFISLHNYAATNTVPGSTSGTNDIATAIETIAGK
jgi:hypothetical protein